MAALTQKPKCVAIDCHKRCQFEGRWRLGSELASLATTATRGRFGRSLAFELDESRVNYLCGEHAMQTLHNVDHVGVTTSAKFVRSDSTLMDIHCYLSHTERSVTAEEKAFAAKPSHPVHAAARERRASLKGLIDGVVSEFVLEEAKPPDSSSATRTRTASQYRVSAQR